MTKFKFDLLDYTEVSDVCELAFTALLDGEKEIEIAYTDSFIFKLSRDTDRGLAIILLSDEGLPLSNALYIYTMHISSQSIAAIMMSIMAGYLKREQVKILKERSSLVREISRLRGEQ